MNDKAFIDTNILVYCFDNAEPEKKEKAIRIIGTLWDTAQGVLSLQVLKEFFVTVTGKLPQKMAIAEARAIVTTFLGWNLFYESRESLEKAFDVVHKHRLSFWDANILAAAILSGCTVLYSEDLQHHQRIEGVEIINPFIPLNPSKAS